MRALHEGEEIVRLGPERPRSYSESIQNLSERHGKRHFPGIDWEKGVQVTAMNSVP